MNIHRRTGYERLRVQRALENWKASEAERLAAQQAIDEGRSLDAEPLERVEKYAHRLAKNLDAMSSKDWGAVPGDLGRAVRESTRPAGESRPMDRRALERIIGEAEEFLSVMFMTRAAVVLNAVGRIIDWQSKDGIGTGFLVAPGVLMTNEHVLPTFEDARGMSVQFRYETDLDDRELAGHEFRLQPERLFVADFDLDFAVVAVEPVSKDGTELAQFGHLPLADVQGKIRIGQPVNIVQHPEGARKQVVFRESALKVLPEVPGTVAHYTGDTKPGSSGSPVFSDAWEVVALHHSGVWDTDAAGNVLDVKGNKWNRVEDPGMKTVNWIANEGIRVSSIVGRLREIHGAGGSTTLVGRELIGAVLETGDRAARDGVWPPARPAAAPAARPARGHEARGEAAPEAAATPAPVGAASFQVPLTVTVSFGGAGGTAAVALAAPAGALERRDVEDYSDRQGFDRDFLGLRVEMPQPQNTIRGNVSTLTGSSEIELRYDHFSVIMNRTRRLAYVSAGNLRIDAPFVAPRRDPWGFDPRMAEDLQADNRFYSDNDLDRGHLFRRADGAWGETAEEARRASADTFHWTNIAPQHFVFNQASRDEDLSLWGLLEDHVMEQAERGRQRMNVFNGPIFDPSDAPHRGLPIPKAYWKALSIRAAAGGLQAFAFVLGQEGLIADLPRERFEAGRFAIFQVKLRDLEARTGLDFGRLREADVMEGARAVERFAPDRAAIRLRSLRDVLFG